MNKQYSASENVSATRPLSESLAEDIQLHDKLTAELYALEERKQAVHKHISAVQSMIDEKMTVVRNNAHPTSDWAAPRAVGAMVHR